MQFRAIIEPGLGHKIKKTVLDFEADNFDAACAFANKIQDELMIRGMCAVIQTDMPNTVDADMSGSITARVSQRYPLFKEQEPKRRCFDCDDGAKDCHMNCGPKA